MGGKVRAAVSLRSLKKTTPPSQSARRLHMLLRWGGFVINHKRLFRIDREERRIRSNLDVAVQRIPAVIAQAPNLPLRNIPLGKMRFLSDDI